MLYSTIKKIYRKVYDLLFDNTFLLIHAFLWFKTQKVLKELPYSLPSVCVPASSPWRQQCFQFLGHPSRKIYTNIYC